MITWYCATENPDQDHQACPGRLTMTVFSASGSQHIDPQCMCCCHEDTA